MILPSDEYWIHPAEDVLAFLQTSHEGLSGVAAEGRLKQFGRNLLRSRRRRGRLQLLLSQFSSPIILILLFACILSFFLRDPSDTVIILVIILSTGLLGFWQEKGATDAVEALLAMVHLTAMVRRNGMEKEIPMEEIVPGDIVVLNAGDSIPGDCLLLESKDLFVKESALTGETFPVEKIPGIVSPEAPLQKRTNQLFMGTHVVSGQATAVVVQTGKRTELGKISERLKLKPPETEFERGIRRFGYFLMEITLILVIAIFAVNVFLHRPVLDSLLFSLALAVGLTPQLLPAIIGINLSHGAKRMAREQVIIKRLACIENFGSMDILCSDKTGTLTQGTVHLEAALDGEGKESEKVKLYAALNSYFESGFMNPIDDAIRKELHYDFSSYRKLDEEPYDFSRRRLSIFVASPEGSVMITKGAVPNILSICSFAELNPNRIVPIEEVRTEIVRRFDGLSEHGFRVLALAYRRLEGSTRIEKNDEREMIFLGFLVFLD